MSLTDRCIKDFLDKLFDNNREIFQEASRKELFTVLPFLRNNSLQTRTRIQKLFRSKLPFTNLKIIYRTSVTLASFFRFKDSVDKSLRSSLVYQYTCSSCNATYIGKTIQHFKDRACENLGLSPLTGRRVMKPIPTAISDHILEHDHPSSFDDFKIIASEPNNFKV